MARTPLRHRVPKTIGHAILDKFPTTARYSFAPSATRANFDIINFPTTIYSYFEPVSDFSSSILAAS